MDCPICGHKMGENDAFCPNCGNFALPLKDNSRPVPVMDPPPGTPADGSALVTPPPELTQDAPKPPRKVAERLYPPPEPIVPPISPESPEGSVRPAASPIRVPESGAVPPKAPDKSGRRLRILAAVACGIAAVAVVVAVYILVTTSSLQVQLNKAQKESSSAQGHAAALEAQVSTLTEDLNAAKADNQALGQQVAELQGQISTMETSVNQSQYDKESAQRALDEANTQLAAANEEKAALQAQLDETRANLETAQAENAALTAEKDTLTQQVAGYQTEVEFYDTYVVFVMLSSSDKYYHKYDCADFTKRNFLAYSVKLAEANGYSPCPKCIGGGTE